MGSNPTELDQGTESVPAGDPINSNVRWFVSDVHLFHGGREYLEQFIRFLHLARDSCSELWIVGDLFEFWIGNRQARFRFYDPLFSTFRELTDHGCMVKIVEGNRDFLLGHVFEESGCELMPDEVVLDLGGRSVHVSHGDQFCVDDHSYQRARTVMRSRVVRFMAACLPAFLGIAFAKIYRKISSRKKSKMMQKTGNRFHTIEKGVLRELEEGGHDIVLCGHIHFLRDQQREVAGRQRRIVTTGAWEDQPNYVSFDGENLEIQLFNSPA